MSQQTENGVALLIETRNVRKYYGKVKGVDKLSFDVDKGEIYGFLGPNGAGKTTTVKILAKIIRDYDGEIKVFGRDLKKWGKEYYEKIGVSFEFPAVYSMLTALENLEFFRSFYKKHLKPSEVLKTVGLSKEADQKVSGFSKGMKKKLDLARAMLPDPEILFLDEPLEGLDPASARKFKNMFLEMKDSGKTIFLTTHNMYVADELCDRVAFIVDGAVKLVDDPDELKVKMGKHRVRVEYYAGRKLRSREFSLEKIGQNKEFISILRKHEVRRINTQEPTLEDIFLSITGRRLI